MTPSIAIAPRVSMLAPVAYLLGVASFSIMDTAMKQLSLAIGVYSALLLRSLAGTAMTAVPAILHTGIATPSTPLLRLHIVRGVVTTLVGLLFFLALTLLPLAEAIALTFVAPIVALLMAGWLLREKVPDTAKAAAVLGLAGVGIVLSGRLSGRYELSALLGALAALGSALCYGYSMILQRQVAQTTTAVEMSLWQNGVNLLVLAPFAPFLMQWPDGTGWALILLAAILVVVSQISMGWAYARAPASRLAPLEYSAFLWAALFGWLFFQEELTFSVLIGAAVIISACLMAARNTGAASTEKIEAGRN